MQGNQLVVSYTLAGDEIEFGIVSFASEPIETTGGEGVPEVLSYRITSVQSATLERQ